MTMNDEKDRLGDKLKDVERAREDHYFAQRDKALLEKMKAGQAAGENIREEALGRCPRCGVPLRHQQLHGVTIDQCEKCGGLWLDKGELEAIGKVENEGWIARWLRTEFDR